MDALGFISEHLHTLKVPYEFGVWTDKLKNLYFVGELKEDEPDTEDGGESSTFILTGTNRGDYLTLEKLRKKIKNLFDPIYGLRGETDEGAIAVFYAGAFQIPTDAADMKRIQITLKIKEWKGAA